jgi:hypothetical protein
MILHMIDSEYIRARNTNIELAVDHRNGGREANVAEAGNGTAGASQKHGAAAECKQ